MRTAWQISARASNESVTQLFVGRGLPARFRSRAGFRTGRDGADNNSALADARFLFDLPCKPSFGGLNLDSIDRSFRCSRAEFAPHARQGRVPGRSLIAFVKSDGPPSIGTPGPRVLSAVAAWAPHVGVWDRTDRSGVRGQLEAAAVEGAISSLPCVPAGRISSRARAVSRTSPRCWCTSCGAPLFERLPGPPHRMEHDGQLARQRDFRLAWAGSVGERERPVCAAPIRRCCGSSARSRPHRGRSSSSDRRVWRCGRSGWSRRTRSASVSAPDRRRRWRIGKTVKRRRRQWRPRAP